ncbi:MAG: hypothetical protein VR65_09865 [Desulfobulbaceae bacterium BRH_c16a]|nr:MAG: hypothetical protein VR65_09865 [Desulfobulbaceae bacterium BRH_c16a]
MHPLLRKRWSPYWVGAAIGGLEVLAMLTAKKPLGITSPFEEAAVIVADTLAPQAMGSETYREKSGKSPEINWEWGLVTGVVLGSMLSARLAKDPLPRPVPDLWQKQVSASPSLRYGGAFLGGALMMFGARMAKGCTSGHGISGTMQFSASSWLFVPIIFSAGAAVAKVLLGRKK